MKIKLETLYTPYTLDTYSTFLSNDHEESEIDNYNEEHGTDYNYDDFDWTYDHKKLVKMLFDNCIELMRDNCIDDIVLAIEPNGEPTSPREYNFSTDKGWIDFEVDHEKLVQFCLVDNKDDYHENKLQDRSGFLWMGNREQTMLAYYLNKKTADDYTPEDYYFDQHDMLASNGGWWDVIECNPIKK